MHNFIYEVGCILHYQLHHVFCSFTLSKHINKRSTSFFRMHMSQCNRYHILSYFCWVGIWLSSTKIGQASMSLDKVKRNYFLISFWYSILLVMHDITFCLFHSCFFQNIFYVTYYLKTAGQNIEYYQWNLSDIQEDNGRSYSTLGSSVILFQG
jgi:hypothetical protein